MRTCGILLHITSLPNKYGIGTVGKCAYDFVDFLKASKQSAWQVLPIGPTSYGDSPYQTFSAFAGNPYFIDFDLLKEEGLLEETDYAFMETSNETEVDYAYQYNNRFDVLKRAYDRFDKENKEYKKFKKANKDWLEDYSLFMTLKYLNNGASWWKWEKPLKLHKKSALTKIKQEYQDNIEFWSFLQYKFFEQWMNLKKYANENGIKIIGDIPIYVAHDSSDVWANPKNWQMDENGEPVNVAGCPPDAFSETGQLWGNPIYNYELMEQEGFTWWIKRVQKSFELYDTVRIDHFRGFESYYSIKYGSENAVNGEWVKGPGIKLFNAIKEKLGEVDIIAEDLGFITEDVYELLRKTGYPGMKILQFGFDSKSDSEYLPHNYVKNCVAYPGSHDNMTVLSWFRGLSEDDKWFVRNYLDMRDDYFICDKVIRACLSSVADTVIIQMQDYIGLGDEGRMNTPSTLGGNWTWRLPKHYLNDSQAGYLAFLATTYRRTKLEEK